MIIWAALYLPRVAFTGFFHDDWWLVVEVQNASAPFSLERLARFMDLGGAFAPRPVQGFICFVVSSLAGKSPVLWQLAAALGSLGCALAVRHFLRTLTRPARAWAAPHRAGWGLAADLGALAVIANPWTIGLTIWAHMAGAVPALAFFALASAQCFRNGPLWMRASLCALFLALSFLDYESFYLQWFVWPILIPVLGGFTRRRLWEAATFACVGVAVQLSAIGYNRWVAVLTQSNSKKTPANWAHLAQESVARLPEQLGPTVPNPPSWWLGFAVALAALGLLAVALRTRTKLSGWMRAGRALIYFPLAAALVVCSATVYALGGYAISAQGFMSRTTYGLNFALALGVFGLVQFGAAAHSAYIRGATLTVALAAIALLGYHQLRALSDFAHVWHVQQEVIRAFPAAKLAGVPHEGTGVLYIGPSYYRNIVIFGATWDLTGAVNNRDGDKRRPYTNLLWFYPATANYNWQWQEGKLTQELPGYWKQSNPLQRLYVWDYYRGTLEPAEEGFIYRASEHPEAHAL